ncbi:MAG: GNAT family N-acetyltransferase [Bacteroidota bacterium]
MIQLLPHNTIDKLKWDACVANSVHAEVYAYSWYLDAVSPGWSALVKNDYEYIMPLPVKRVYGFTYIVQPPFCQKLGIFSHLPLSHEIISQFTKYCKRYFSIRYSSYHSLLFSQVNEEPNYVIDLSQEYSKIKTKFNKNCLRNCKKAHSEIQGIEFISPDNFLDFFRTTLIYSIPKSYHLSMAHLVQILHKNDKLQCLAAYSDDNIVAAVAYIVTETKVYYFLAGSNEDGKEKKAMFLLVQSCIESHAGTPKQFDFEGSRIPGVAQFYKGFGAVNEPYFLSEYTKIPFLHKIF